MNFYDVQMPPEQPRKKGRGRAFVVTAVVLLVLAAAGVLVYKNVFIGTPSIDLSVFSVTVSDDTLELSGRFNSAAGLKGYSCMVDEDTVVIELRSAWPLFGINRSFSIELTGDFSDVSEVNLSDGRNSLVVWTYGQPSLPEPDENQ